MNLLNDAQQTQPIAHICACFAFLKKKKPCIFLSSSKYMLIDFREREGREKERERNINQLTLACALAGD